MRDKTRRSGRGRKARTAQLSSNRFPLVSFYETLYTVNVYSIKAFKFRLRAKPAAERCLNRWNGQLRWVWNQALAEQQRRHAAGEKFATYVDMCKWLTAWRNAPETAWLAEGPVHAQQQVLKRLEASYKRFFEAAKKGDTRRVKPPRFKHRGDDPGIRFPDPKGLELDQQNGRIKLPKLGWVRIRQSCKIIGELRNVTLTTKLGKWYVSIQVRVPEVLPAADLQSTLGIDLGLVNFATLSTGEHIQPLRALACKQARLRRHQKSMSRKVKGSANWKKAVKKVGRTYQRVANCRADWTHKLTTELADRHVVIAIEDLKVANMSASAKGTAAVPGKRVRQKAGLNKAILDASWAEFRRQLGYKLTARGGQLIAVDPAYTSQTCHACGHVDAANRTSQSTFTCVACGHTDHADVNAARNILARAKALADLAQIENVQIEQEGPDMARIACREDVSRARPARARHAASVKQEPAEVLGLS